MILEEQEEGGASGVMVKEVVIEGGSAWTSGIVAPGDVLLEIDQVDVTKADFDTVMDLLASPPPTTPQEGIMSSGNSVKITFGDGLGQLDMPKNVLKQLKTSNDAFLIDAVVRQAVREIRRDGRLGELRNVEVVIGAGVQENGQRGMARFFAIFSTDGVTTYSCNISATGIRQGDTNSGGSECKVKIVSLSCAKDEGLGRTYDLISEAQ